MRPRNCLAFRLVLPLAIVVSSAFPAGAGPMVAHTVAPEAKSPGASVPKSKSVGKGAPASRRPGKGSALPSTSPRDRPASQKDEDHPTSVLGDPSPPRATDEGNEVNDVTPPEQASSSTQGLSPGGSPLLLLPLPPNHEPGEARTHVGEPSVTTDTAAGEVVSPIGTHDAVSPPRGAEESSTPRTPVTPSLSNAPATTTPAATTPVARTPDRRETIPAAPVNATDRGASDPSPVLQAPQGADVKVSPGAAGSVVASPNPISSAVGSASAGSTARGPASAGPVAAEPAGGTPGPAGTSLPHHDPGVAKPTGITNGAGTTGQSTGMPPDTQSFAVANAPGPVSGSSGGMMNEAAQGTAGMSSMDKANAFGQMLTAAVIAQELSNPGRTGGGDSQVQSSTEKSPLAMSDRALLAEVGGTTPLDANPGASDNVGGAGPLDPIAGTTAPSAPSVPRVPDLPLPAVEVGAGVRQSTIPALTSGTPLNPTVSPVAIPEPTPLVQFVAVLAGSAFMIARRRSRG